MKRRVSILSASFLAASSLGISFAPNAAFAIPVVEVPNPGTVTINGTYLGSPNPNPAVYQVFAAANQCLRIEGTSTYDIEATLVSPGGTVWQDDDSAGNLQPLIKAITPTNGWYTLQINHYSAASSTGNFTVQIKRLPNSDPSCTSPTPPKFTSSATAK